MDIEIKVLNSEEQISETMNCDVNGQLGQQVFTTGNTSVPKD